MPRNEPTIVGIAETRYTRQPERPTPELLAEAAALALEDARLRPQDVDGLGVSSFSLAPDHAIDLAWRLGLRVRWLMEDTNGGASGLNMLQHARRACWSMFRPEAPPFVSSISQRTLSPSRHARSIA